MSEIKLTIGKLKSIEESLGQLVNEKLPIKIAYRVSKLLPILQKEFKEAEDFRLKLINKYGTEGEDGNISVNPENMEQFITELNELYSEEISFEFEPISVEALPDDISLTALQLANLSDFFS